MWLKDQARSGRQWRGTRAHLKGRRPSPPTEWGVHNQLGSEASSLCFYYWLLCTTRKAPPSSRHAWLLRSVPGGLCASQMVSPSSQADLGCSITEASNIQIPCPSEFHLHPRMCEKEDKTDCCPCCHTWGISVGQSSLTAWVLLIPYLWCLGVHLVFNCQSPLLKFGVGGFDCSSQGPRLWIPLWHRGWPHTICTAHGSWSPYTRLTDIFWSIFFMSGAVLGVHCCR